jgi:hypothetical protein
MKPRISAATELSPAVIAVLLGGWSAKPVASGAPTDDDGLFFELFEANEAGIIRLWRRHEAFLRAEARRLGIEPAFPLEGRHVYFGELCAAEGLT